MKSIFSCSVVFLLFISCAIYKTPDGYYTNNAKKYSGSYELALFHDGTYSCKFNGHMISFESTGNWVEDSLHQIYLTSEKQYKNDFRVFEEEKLSDKIAIKVIDRKAQESLPGASVVIYSNGKVRGFSTNKDGIAEFYSLDKIDSIHVRFISFHDVWYNIKDQKSNNFIVEIDQIPFEYLFLKDEKLILKRNKFRWVDESGSFLDLKGR
jgi:hypothetical protein